MKLTAHLRRAAALTALVCLAALQAGCSKDVGEHIASVNKKISEGKFAEARDEGSAFLKANEDGSGQLAWALARANARLGNQDMAIDYAAMAVNAGAVSGIQLMSEPMLEPLRTHPRFTALAAGISSPGPTASPAASAGIDAAVRASAGVEATAGDVSVTLPD